MVARFLRRMITRAFNYRNQYVERSFARVDSATRICRQHDVPHTLCMCVSFTQAVIHVARETRARARAGNVNPVEPETQMASTRGRVSTLFRSLPPANSVMSPTTVYATLLQISGLEKPRNSPRNWVDSTKLGRVRQLARELIMVTS